MVAFYGSRGILLGVIESLKRLDRRFSATIEKKNTDISELILDRIYDLATA